MLAGEQFGRYEIRGKIGEGGMGEVYSATDLELDRNVAIKLLPNEFTVDEERRSRFRQEAKVVSALNHPNVITIYEIGENDFGHFLATEYVEGKTLREVIKRESLTLGRILRIIEQSANALVAAHNAHVVHRDVKPENIMVRRDGIVKVLDFGLAKPVVGFKNEAASGDNKTIPGTVMGSARYMSPEQARGLEVDERTDIWSLGVVLYELLVGKAPFDGETTADTLAAVIYQEPEPIANILPNTPIELQRIIRKALQKDREERYQSVKDLALDVKDLLHELEHSTSGNRTGHVTSNPQFSENPTIIHRTLSGNHQTGPTYGVRSAANSIVVRERAKWPAALAAVFALLTLAFGGYAIYSVATAETPLAESAFLRPQISRINTDGRVMLPSISPDGKYIAYVAGEAGGRSLVVRQIATDSVVTVVPPSNQNLQSVTFSPTGDHIYYCLTSTDFSINTLYQVPTLGGTPKKLIEDVDSAVTFSPDGKQFAFVRHRADPIEDVIFVANTDNLSMERLISNKDADYDFFSFRLAWSPDGKTLLTGAGKRESGFVTKTDMVEITLLEKKVRPINQREFFSVNNVVWFADGSGFLFSGRENQNAPNQIWRASYPAGDVEPVTNDFNDYLDVSISTDGRNIATLKGDTVSSVWRYSLDSKKGTQVGGDSRTLEGMHGLIQRRDGALVFTKTEGKETDLWTSDIDGRNQRALHSEPGYSVMPVATADGKYLVFNIQKDKTSKIWRSDADGKNLVRLSDGDASSVDFQPQVTPDGQHVIFQRKSGDERFFLMKVPIDGGAVQTFHETLNWSMFMPKISPDGKRLAYTTYDVKTFQKKLLIAKIEEGNVFGGVEQEIEYNLINQYAWSPDGKTLTVLTSRSGIQNLWSQPLDGSAPKQITDFQTGRILNFAWAVDGKELILARGNTNNDLILIKDADRIQTGQTVARRRTNNYDAPTFNLYNFLLSSVR
jgi:eukaryotic-like serine/threonine-protein kinase